MRKFDFIFIGLKVCFRDIVFIIENYYYVMMFYFMKLFFFCKFRSLEGNYKLTLSFFCIRIRGCGLVEGLEKKIRVFKELIFFRIYGLNFNFVLGNGWRSRDIWIN